MTPKPQDPGGGIRGPTVVAEGGSITVDLAPNDTTVEVSEAGGGFHQSTEVPPGKSATVPIPGVRAGAVLYVRIGRGPRARLLVVEVVSTFR